MPKIFQLVSRLVGSRFVRTPILSSFIYCLYCKLRRHKQNGRVTSLQQGIWGPFAQCLGHGYRPNSTCREFRRVLDTCLLTCPGEPFVRAFDYIWVKRVRFKAPMSEHERCSDNDRTWEPRFSSVAYGRGFRPCSESALVLPIALHLAAPRVLTVLAMLLTERVHLALVRRSTYNQYVYLFYFILTFCWLGAFYLFSVDRGSR